MWDTAFVVANIVAVLTWAGLIVLPRWPALLTAILYLGIGLLCLGYSALFLGLNLGLIDPVRADGAPMPATEYSVDGLIDLFASRGVMTVGWIHYLAFDLFVGLWIARDADAKNFSRWVQAPILLATFLAGPLGLLVWLAVRERRARRLGRGT